MKKVKVIQYGLGPIGCGIVKAVSMHSQMELVGVVDIDPDKVGKELNKIISLNCNANLKVCSSLAEALDGKSADAAIHCTSSKLGNVVDQLKEMLNAGLHVISTCEELAYPWYRFPKLSEDIDNSAKKAEKALVGTGVNPGFAMDMLPLVYNHAVLDVKEIRIERVLDAGRRRGSLQKKVGAGMEISEFMAFVADEKIGHAGFIESIALLAAGLGWELDEIKQQILPVIAEENIRTEFLEVKAGQVAVLTRVGGVANKVKN
ncbi:MAG: hypothetical protein KGZ79_03000 [Dethiobacter sp.]|nr:hypothetical protein [Dethiobacter sp.]